MWSNGVSTARAGRCVREEKDDPLPLGELHRYASTPWIPRWYNRRRRRRRYYGDQEVRRGIETHPRNNRRAAIHSWKRAGSLCSLFYCGGKSCSIYDPWRAFFLKSLAVLLHHSDQSICHRARNPRLHPVIRKLFYFQFLGYSTRVSRYKHENIRCQKRFLNTGSNTYTYHISADK